MAYKIDITNMDGHSLRELLAKFPNGKVVVDGVKAFWNAADSTTNVIGDNLGEQPKQVQQAPGRNPIRGMQDYLFGAFS